jgi:CBS domain containing-hemolysin-like protein
MFVTWAVIIGLILVSALYVAAEFAAVGVRRSRLRRLAEDGNAMARGLLPMVEDPRHLDRYIAASQIGITLSSLVLGAYGQATLSGVVEPWVLAWGIDASASASTAAALVLISLTAIGVVLGELVPKSLALQYPTRSALMTFLPMKWSLQLFAPFIAFLNGSGILILRAVGVHNAGHRHIHSPEEIDLLIAESRDGGLLEPQEHVRLHRALKLGLRTAGQLMVPRERIAAIGADASVEDVVEAVLASPYTRLPVYRDTIDNILGIIRTKDVVLQYVTHGSNARIESLMKPVARVPQELAADKLLAFMREQRSHQAIVIDRDGRVAGLITLEDVLAHLLGRG